jgi:hypothetical protein
MSLTRDNWITLIGTFGPVVFLIIVADIGIREWRQPDVRYTAGSTYLSTKLAVASVTLKNWGHTDAENVIVTASFADPLSVISTSQPATPFVPFAGGIGHKLVTGTIARLVPDESVSIYFITEPSSPWPALQGQFLQGIKFNGGLGKTGAPWLPWLLVNLLAVAVVGGMYVGLYYQVRRERAISYDYFSETVRMGLSAAQEGLSEAQLRTRVEAYRRTIPWLRRPGKEYLIRSAQAGVAGARQSPTAPSP